MDKPREFWVLNKNSCPVWTEAMFKMLKHEADVTKIKRDSIHTIEHSAYESLKQQNEKQKALIETAKYLLIGVSTQKQIPLAQFHLWLKDVEALAGGGDD